MDLDTKKNIPGGMFFLDYMYIYDNISVFPANFVTKFIQNMIILYLENSNRILVLAVNSNELRTISTLIIV